MHPDKDSHLNGAVSGTNFGARESDALSRDTACWLLEYEMCSVGKDQHELAAAVERICQKFFNRLARVTSLVACQALLSRALHEARHGFAFLEPVRAGTTNELLVEGLTASVEGVDLALAREGLQAMLARLIALLASLIGQDLTLRMLRDVWPGLPISEPASLDDANFQYGAVDDH